MSNFITVKEGILSINFGGEEPFGGGLGDLRSGGVLDASRGQLLLRAWKVDTEIHVAHQFGHDASWPHGIFVFPLPSGDCGVVYSLRMIPLHQYLAQGGGIPANDRRD